MVLFSFRVVFFCIKARLPTFLKAVEATLVEKYFLGTIFVNCHKCLNVWSVHEEMIYQWSLALWEQEKVHHDISDEHSEWGIILTWHLSYVQLACICANTNAICDHMAKISRPCWCFYQNALWKENMTGDQIPPLLPSQKYHTPESP